MQAFAWTSQTASTQVTVVGMMDAATLVSSLLLGAGAVLLAVAAALAETSFFCTVSSGAAFAVVVAVGGLVEVKKVWSDVCSFLGRLATGGVVFEGAMVWSVFAKRRRILCVSFDLVRERVGPSSGGSEGVKWREDLSGVFRQNPARGSERNATTSVDLLARGS